MPDGKAETLGQPPSGNGNKRDDSSSLRRRSSRIFSRFAFSSLARRILMLNLLGLVVLVSGILFLNQFRDSLIEARVEKLVEK